MVETVNTSNNETARAWQDLGIAIVVQACHDWRREKKKFETAKDPRQKERHAAELRSIERFFNGKFYKALFDIDPDEIIDYIYEHKTARIEVVTRPNDTRPRKRRIRNYKRQDKL